MNERLLARVLFVMGFGIVSLASFFGSGWDEAGVFERATLILGFVAATIAVGFDFKHRREDKRSRSSMGGGSV